MTRYYLGADVGATKTHALITDEEGRAIGFGVGGPGNHENVEYEGLLAALRTATDGALRSANLTKDQIAGAGFGVAGYDWPSERTATLETIAKLGFTAPVDAVNDTIIGLMAGAIEGWGIAVISGTGCNCRGWDKAHTREGMVTGGGDGMAEYAGATDIVQKAVRAISLEWSCRGPATALTPAFMKRVGASDPTNFLEGLITHEYSIDGSAAPLVFEIAAQGDPVALELVRWAGRELGELVKAVVRQLQFEALEFDVVMVGSMFKGGPLMIEPMRETIHELAPNARLVRLTAPPVTGAVLLGMQTAGVHTPPIHKQLLASAEEFLKRNEGK